MHIAALSVYYPGRRPAFFFLRILREPIFRIASAHKRNGVKPLCTELAATAVPTVFYSEPISAIERAHIYTVTVVPCAVAVAIGETLVRRIVVSVDMLYRPVGIQHMHGVVARAEDHILLASYNVAERIIITVLHRLVHI